MHERLQRLRELLEQLRPYIRPEGDAGIGAVNVAVDQLQAEAEALGVPPAPTPVDVQLQALRAELGNLLHVPTHLSLVREDLAVVGANVSAMRESAGL